MPGRLQYVVPSQTGRLAVVTGTGGLGFQAGLALAKAGAHIILAGRSNAKGCAAAASIMSMVPNARVEFEILDLASLASVRAFGARLIQRGEPIGLLINNAGIMSPPNLQVTVDGHEAQFGVNYLAHFALTAGLASLLRDAGGARVVNVTSLAQHYAKFDMGNLRSEMGYHPGKAYCLSKLLQAMFAKELQCRSEAAGWGITSVAAHPGFAGTNLFDTGSSVSRFVSTRIILPLLGQPASAGALPILFAATSPEASGGALYGPQGFMQMRGRPGPCQFAKIVDDAPARTALWQRSETLAGVRFQ